METATKLDVKNSVKWRKIKGFENYYVSYMGEVFNIEKGSFLKPQKHTHGYFKVNLKGKFYFVHRLVADAFIDNPDNLPIINHKDGRKWNNAFINLEWCTHKMNTEHAISIGLFHRKLK